jgi:uncharacterized protein YqjF (DUF2071 family)
MGEIPKILSDVTHRPWHLPVGRWRFYQEWNQAIFLHWVVPVSVLESHIPRGLNIDTIDGRAYVSLVAFTMQKIRPRNLPSISLVSEFHEINLRTYINNDGKPGVYFLSIEAEKALAVYVAKKLSGLPYRKSTILRTAQKYISLNGENKSSLDVEFEIGQSLEQKSELDKWLTERYCLYLDVNSKIFRFDIHHKEWPIKKVNLKHLELQYRIGTYSLSEKLPELMHYSDGVKVISWGRKEVI